MKLNITGSALGFEVSGQAAIRFDNRPVRQAILRDMTPRSRWGTLEVEAILPSRKG